VKRFFHDDTDWQRVRRHMPHGFILIFLAATVIFAPVAALCWSIFRSYEEDECLHKEDEAWNDYLGVLFGGAIVVILLLAGIVLVMVRLWG